MEAGHIVAVSTAMVKDCLGSKLDVPYMLLLMSKSLLWRLSFLGMLMVPTS